MISYFISLIPSLKFLTLSFTSLELITSIVFIISYFISLIPPFSLSTKLSYLDYLLNSSYELKNIYTSVVIKI